MSFSFVKTMEQPLFHMYEVLYSDFMISVQTENNKIKIEKEPSETITQQKENFESRETGCILVSLFVLLWDPRGYFARHAFFQAMLSIVSLGNFLAPRLLLR